MNNNTESTSPLNYNDDASYPFSFFESSRLEHHATSDDSHNTGHSVSAFMAAKCSIGFPFGGRGPAIFLSSADGSFFPGPFHLVIFVLKRSSEACIGFII